MTDGRSASKDIRTKGRGKNRNRTTDADGNPYDRRKGTWTRRDEALEEASYAIVSWFTKERYGAELEMLNPPGKPGRRYTATPSLVNYVSMLMDYLGLSYRRVTGLVRFIFELQGIPAIDFTTLFKDEDKFASEFGERIICEATDKLRSQGITEEIDPLDLIRSGVTPEYGAPQKIPTCQADVDGQMEKDREAEYLRSSMEVAVFSEFSDAGPLDVAIDGSGQAISGTGIYFEHIWQENNRSFIKQHAAVDLETRKAVGFSITLEKPGDAKVFGPIVSGITGCGVSIRRAYADSAYDTKGDWRLCEELGIEFIPNLRSRFGEDPDLPGRNRCLLAEKAQGKSGYHRTTGYNRRWLVEVFFSVIKRMYGERLRAKKFHKMVIRMRNIYRLHNIHRRYMYAVECGIGRSVKCRMGGWGLH